MTDERCGLLCLDVPGVVAIRAELEPTVAETAAARAKALGDPTRLLIALALRHGDELCLCDLAWIAGRAENLVGHRLRQLRGAGLVRSRRDGKVVFYALTAIGRALVDAHLATEATV